MKVLESTTNSSSGIEQPAETVMETVSAVMRTVRREMRRGRPAELPMQQFRALRVVEKHPGASLLTVANHLDLTPASASKLVDALVRDGLVTRVDSPEDRRKVVLNATPAGRLALEVARKAALGRLADLLAKLSERDRSTVIRAMDILSRALTEGS